MIRDGSDGSREVEIQLSTLCVSSGDGIDVLKDTIQEVVDISLGDIVVRDDDCADSDSVDILRRAVSILGDGVLGIVRGLGDQLLDVLVIQADQVDRLESPKD